MTDHYAIIGNPIKHSKSPLIHSEFAKQTGEDLDYIAQIVSTDDLTNNFRKLQESGFKGINITVPFKEQVSRAIKNKSDRATLAGAVNTVTFNPNGSIYGDNTDGVGLCRDLVNNNQISLGKKRILLLGAGGAARGIIQSLIDYEPAELIIANRTIHKAKKLAKKFANFNDIFGCGFKDIIGSFDVIINATSGVLHGRIPPLATDIMHKNTSFYDMVYSNISFIEWAKRYGATKAINGLGMLVEQAAESFYLWRGIKPNTEEVIRKMRNL